MFLIMTTTTHNNMIVFFPQKCFHHFKRNVFISRIVHHLNEFRIPEKCWELFGFHNLFNTATKNVNNNKNQ